MSPWMPYWWSQGRITKLTTLNFSLKRADHSLELKEPKVKVNCYFQNTVGTHEGISPCKERDKKKAAQNPGGEDRVSSPRLDFARPFYSQFSFDSPKTDVKWSTRGVMIIMLRECLNCLWKTMKKSLCFLGSITSRCSFRRKEKWSDLLPFNQVRVNRLMMPF